MSTRHARTADKALNERLSKTLKELLKQPANKYCADCKRKDPRWASWNIGIFVCIRCSGIHRSMGTHISKVKSVDLDTWIPEQVENMQRWGNERANKYWEANLKDMRPSESNIDMWIRAKYEQKRWAMKGPIPDPSTLGGDDLETPSSPASPQRASQITTTTTTTKKDFINLDDFLGSPSSSPAQSAKSTPSAAAQLQGADFFLNNPSQPAKQPAASAASTEQQQQQQPKQQDDFKSKILSLYNQTPPAATTLNNNANGGYLNNMSNYQQQLSGLSMGTGIIPQAPPGHSFQNVWGSFTSAPPAQQQTAALPQGSQFFTSASNGSPGPGKKQQQQPAYDAFADLLK